MSVNVPLHKWRSADPAILIGRRCIARTNDDVVIDGRLELIRRPDGAVCIAPEDDEERQACGIAVNALLSWSAEHDKEKEQQ